MWPRGTRPDSPAREGTSAAAAGAAVGAAAGAAAVGAAAGAAAVPCTRTARGPGRPSVRGGKGCRSVGAGAVGAVGGRSREELTSIIMRTPCVRPNCIGGHVSRSSSSYNISSSYSSSSTYSSSNSASSSASTSSGAPRPRRPHPSGCSAPGSSRRPSWRAGGGTASRTGMTASRRCAYKRLLKDQQQGITSGIHSRDPCMCYQWMTLILA